MKIAKTISGVVRGHKWITMSFVAVVAVAAIVGYYLSSPTSLEPVKMFLSGAVNLKTSSVKCEYGTEVKLDAANILDTNDASILKSAQFDYGNLKFNDGKLYPEPGAYNIKISYKVGSRLLVDRMNVVVSDTTAPEFVSAPDSVEVTQGGSDSDITALLKVKDLSETATTFDKSAVKFDIPGNYSVTIVAIDKFGNSTKKSLTIKIVAKAQPNNNGTLSPTYINGILFVNKKHPLPSNYAPGENAVAGSQIRKLIADMKAQGLSISDSYSGYRSYQLQAQLYRSYAKQYGQAKADTFSARAGYSEHQTGLAFDLHTSNGSLIRQGPEATWLADNAYKYGFIVRYQAGKESMTGYQAEPWHLRYIGDEAEPIYRSGLSLEQYLGAIGGDY